MSNNKFYIFGGEASGGDILTDLDYEADTHRLIGNQLGVARRELVNKALKQSTYMSAALGQMIANITGREINDSMPLSDLSDLLTLAVLGRVDEIYIGNIGMFPKDSPPNELWLNADGSEFKRSEYPMLFAYLGTDYGGDGVTTFKVPDLRGYHPRFSDRGRGIATDVLTGSFLDDAIRAHTHTASTNTTGAHAHTLTISNGGDHAHTAYSAGAGTHNHRIASELFVENSGGSRTWVTGNQVTGRWAEKWTDGVGDHAHGVGVNSGGAHAHNGTVVSAGDHSHTITINSAGSAENRVKTAGLCAFIYAGRRVIIP